MKYPRISIITPTTADRSAYNERLAKIVQMQDYKGGIEHIWCYDLGTIGEKRNSLCEQATGEIIIHADSDDLYLPDWITKSVKHLIDSKADLTGLSSIYFYQPDIFSWQWSNVSKQPIIAGATMCYWRKTWERNKFKEINSGEDTQFCGNAGRIIPHDYIKGFIATIHNSNTASHEALKAKEVKAVDVDIVRNILKFVR